MSTDYDKMMEEYDRAEEKDKLNAARKAEWQSVLSDCSDNMVGYWVAQQIENDSEATKMFQKIRKAMAALKAGSEPEEEMFKTLQDCRNGLVPGCTQVLPCIPVDPSPLPQPLSDRRPCTS